MLVKMGLLPLLAVLAGRAANAGIVMMGFEIESNNVDLDHTKEAVRSWVDMYGKRPHWLSQGDGFDLTLDVAASVHTKRRNGRVQWTSPDTVVDPTPLRPEVISKPFPPAEFPKVLEAVRQHYSLWHHNTTTGRLTLPPPLQLSGTVQRETAWKGAALFRDRAEPVCGGMHVTVEVPVEDVPRLWESALTWYKPCDDGQLAVCYGESGRMLEAVKRLAGRVPFEGRARDAYVGFLVLLGHSTFILSRSFSGNEDYYRAFMHPKLQFGNNVPTHALPVLTRSHLGDMWRAVTGIVKREAGEEQAAKLPALLREQIGQVRPGVTLESRLLPIPIKPYYSDKFIMRAAHEAAQQLPAPTPVETPEAFAAWMSGEGSRYPPALARQVRKKRFVASVTRMYHAIEPGVVNITVATYVDSLFDGVDRFSDRDAPPMADGNFLYKSLGSVPVGADGHARLEFRSNKWLEAVYRRSPAPEKLVLPFRPYVKCPSTCPIYSDAPKVLAAVAARLRDF